MTTYALDLSLIHCHGADARDFLHNQLTQSVNDVDHRQARLFAYCSPRGRVLANGLFWADPQSEDAIYMLVHGSVAESLVSRLKMYVLRAKVELELIDATITGTTQPAFLADLPQPPSNLAWELNIFYSADQQQIAIQAPGTTNQPQRFWQIAPSALTTPSEPTITANNWRWQELNLGWPWVQQPISEVFIPQNLNLDILPAVNFQKGCFPGQEIVARSHYRATIRRRALLFSMPLTPPYKGKQAIAELIGTDIMMSADEQSRVAGRIADIIEHNEQLWLLAETNLDFILEKAKLHLPDDAATELSMQPLPFQEQLPWEAPKKRS